MKKQLFLYAIGLIGVVAMTAPVGLSEPPPTIKKSTTVKEEKKPKEGSIELLTKS